MPPSAKAMTALTPSSSYSVFSAVKTSTSLPRISSSVSLPEVEALAARKDGRQDFIRFGGAKDENDVLWRFLKGLQ
jgi:hypothetical protein